MSSPKTMARCSLESWSLVYKWRKMSGPCVVGIRALAMHSTFGKLAVICVVLVVLLCCVWPDTE